MRTNLANAGVANEEEFEEEVVFAGVHVVVQGKVVTGSEGPRAELLCRTNPRELPAGSSFRTTFMALF